MKHSLLALALLALLAACADDDDERDTPYPSIVTNFADGETNAEGYMYRLTLDDDTPLILLNPYGPLQPQAVYRALCGYVVDEADTTRATLYQATGVYVLRDSSATLRHDATAVDAVWLTPHYINLQLQPKTQGLTQTWGYAVDSIRGDALYLSLHHNQKSDPTSYSTTVYASLPIDSMPHRSIDLTIHTFQGPRTWHFTR